MTYNLMLNKGRLQAVDMPEKPDFETYLKYEENGKYSPSCRDFSGPNEEYALDMEDYYKAVEKAKSEAIDFRPEDYSIGKNIALINIDVERGLSIKIKEGEIRPCPEGFEIEIVQCCKHDSCPVDGKCEQCKEPYSYARLVPIKEQKKDKDIENLKIFYQCVAPHIVGHKTATKLFWECIDSLEKRLNQ